MPSADGWELVLAENIAYLVDDQRRWQVLEELRSVVGLEPEQILAAPEDALCRVVAGARPAERAQRLRRCAELAVAGAPWRATQASGRRGPTALTCSPGSGASLLWMLTACGCLPGWASATPHAPMRPATAGLRLRPASSCPRQCQPASAPTSSCAGPDRSSADVKSRSVRSVLSAPIVPAPTTRHLSTDVAPASRLQACPIRCRRTCARTRRYVRVCRCAMSCRRLEPIPRYASAQRWTPFTVTAGNKPDTRCRFLAAIGC